MNRNFELPYAVQKSFLQTYYESENMHCIIEPTAELGGLYLGNIDAASDLQLLRKHRIEAVLTVAARTNIRYNESLIPHHEIIVSEDHPSQNLFQYFDRIYDFIERTRQHTNVLVHCFAGVSRSVTSVIMYLMRKNSWTYEKAFFHVKQKRRVAAPNPGFVRQLLEFERRLSEQRAQSRIAEYRNQTLADERSIPSAVIEYDRGNQHQRLLDRDRSSDNLKSRIEYVSPTKYLRYNSYSDKKENQIAQQLSPSKYAQSVMSNTGSFYTTTQKKATPSTAAPTQPASALKVQQQRPSSAYSRSLTQHLQPVPASAYLSPSAGPSNGNASRINFYNPYANQQQHQTSTQFYLQHPTSSYRPRATFLLY